MKPEPLTKEKKVKGYWDCYKEEDVRSAYLWAVERIEERMDETTSNWYKRGLAQSLDFLKKAFEAVSKE